MKAPIDILLVEDNPEDVRLTKEALIDTGLESTLNHVADGEEAIKYLERAGQYDASCRPDLILLDINMPKMDGHQVLEYMQGKPELEEIPVVLLTVSRDQIDIERALNTGMNYYLNKPVDPEQLQDVIATIGELWS